jgi:hypothetical protein
MRAPRNADTWTVTKGVGIAILIVGALVASMALYVVAQNPGTQVAVGRVVSITTVPTGKLVEVCVRDDPARLHIARP